MNNRLRNVLLVLLAPLSASAATVTDLRADSAMLDGKTGQYFYRGNTLLSQENVRINADEMQATQDENGNLKTGRFRGQPASLAHVDPVSGAVSEARADEIVYDAASGRIELIGNASLLQKEDKLGREMQLSGNQIELVETGTRLNTLRASGAPVQFSRQETGALPVQGQANSLRFDGDNEKLVLEGEAKLLQGPTRFEHVIIEYDGQRKIITAPKRDGQQVKITRVQDNTTPSGDNRPDNDKKEPL